jgi:hypothetical protein
MVIKAMRMRLTGHVACMKVMRDENKVLFGKPEGKRPLEDTGIDGRIILELILQKQCESVD